MRAPFPWGCREKVEGARGVHVALPPQQLGQGPAGGVTSGVAGNEVTRRQGPHGRGRLSQTDHDFHGLGIRSGEAWHAILKEEALPSKPAIQGSWRPAEPLLQRRYGDFPHILHPGLRRCCLTLPWTAGQHLELSIGM